MRFSLIGPVYPYRGGIAHYTTFLDHSLRDNEHQTLVISFRRQYPKWLYPGKSDQDPSTQIFNTKALYPLDPFYPWTWVNTSRMITRFKPALVVIQWWTTFWGLPFSMMNRYLHNHGVKVTYLIHNVLPHEERFWDKWIARRALSGKNYYIVQTIREKDRLLTLIPNAAIYLCKHPLYNLPAKQNINKDSARKQLNLPVESTILLFFGIVRRYKGLRMLLQALSILHQKGYYPTLIIAGEFWEDKRQYLDMIDEYQLSDQVIIDDRYIPNEEIETLFTSADVFVAPYTAGTQSGVVGLAIGFGLPLIVSDQIAAGIEDTHKSGVLEFPTDDPQALASVIRQYMDHPISVDRKTQSSKDEWKQIVNTLEEIALD